MKYRFNAILMILLFFQLPFAAPSTARAGSAAQDTGWRKLLVDASDQATLNALAKTGAEQLVDYGAFSLWRVPQSFLPQSVARGQAQEVRDGILLRDAVILTGDSVFQTSSRPPAREDAKEGLWLVQFIGPPLPEWVDGLRAAGLEIVSYVPNNAYLVWGANPAAKVEAAAESLQPGLIEISAPYPPAYRLSPSLRVLAESPAPGEIVDVTVQIYNTTRLPETIAALEKLALAVLIPPETLLNTTAVRVSLPVERLVEISAWADVLNIEPYAAPELLDEIQGQILAGNLMQISQSLLPNSPGYLEWLRRKGFPTQPSAYPLVDIMDDGLDSGNINNILHPDFYVFGSKANASRVVYIRNCTDEPAGNGVAGHGDLNAGILAGYNNRPEAIFRDSQGYQRGLGVSPYGPIASTKLFRNDRRFNVSRCFYGGDILTFPIGPVSEAYRSGARITTNSWGRQTQEEYDTTAQTYDILTRDAVSDPGNQEMLHIFAAGNLGPDRYTVSSPGTAKNVMTVGATENVRANGVMDGCNVAEGSSANNIAEFSSRGPTRGGRNKPEIVAPGTHVQGPASQATGFNGSGVCGSGDPNADGRYYPRGQTLYTWSSGTSHSAPAIAGVAQLTYNYYQRVLRPGQTPSPAMAKALLLNAPRYLDGNGAGDTLPSNRQGWGSANMGAMFDFSPRLLVDQESVFSRSGEMVIINDQIRNPNRSMRVTLVWTDAPGSTVAQRALVNNLDLEVVVNGTVYRGNVFYRDTSVPGGDADQVNNVENVFLPAGLSGAVEIRIIARGISGNGVPGNATPYDQDFALVVYNSGTAQAVEQPYNFFIPSVLDQGERAAAP